MKDWIDRAVAFIEHMRSFGDGVVRDSRCSPPMPLEDIDSIAGTFQRPLPEPLREFYSTATSWCSMWYRLESPLFYGGVSLFPLADIGGLFGDCEETGKSIAEDSEEAGAQWVNAFPFCPMANGDMLALDMRHGAVDPPVIYLSHEGDCLRPLAPNFDIFLREWENLCYAGPESNMLSEFIDGETGFLNSAVLPAVLLRRRLGMTEA